MAILKVFSLVLIVISVKSQQYGYPYQAGYPVVQQPVQNVNQPENALAWYPQVVQQPAQTYGGYYGYIPQQQPATYYPVNPQSYPNAILQTVQQKQAQPLQQQYERIDLPQEPKKSDQGAQQAQQQQQQTSDPYANIPTEMIDVDPENFNRIMQQLHAEPRIVSYETRVKKNRIGQPHFKVITETKKSNNTDVPKPIQTHQIINKIYSFNKTYVLHPGQEKKSVINLNFVNGVQVTDAPDNLEEENPTTTSSPEDLKKLSKKFIDVPEGCEEGDGFSATGGCFSPFKLHLNGTTQSGNPSTNITGPIVTTTNQPRIQTNRRYGARY